MSRTKNATRNIVWGVINKVVTIFIPFFTRTAIIRVLGMQYAGIGNLFASILSVLSLAELGFGEALVYSMYKPLAENDQQKVMALLNFYRRCYRIIGIIITSVGLCVLPFIKFFAKGDVPNDINIYFLFSIYLFNTAISYFLFAYKRSLLIASQREDLSNKVNLLISFSTSILQIIGLILFKSFYAFALLIPAATLASNICVAIVSNYYYPEYKCHGKIDEEQLAQIKKNVYGMLFQKIGNTILNSADTIIISLFMGVTMVAYYNNYYYIVTAAGGIMGAISSALTPEIGHMISTEDKSKNYSLFMKIASLEGWILIVFSSCMMGLYRPFMKMWVGEENMLPSIYILIFVTYFFVYKMNDVCYIYRQAAGLWWEGRWMPIVSSAINISLNLFLIQYIGLAGIAISTIISVVLVNVIWGSILVFKEYFDDYSMMKKYLLFLARNILSAIVVLIPVGYVCNMIEDKNLLVFGLKIIICVVLPNILLLAFNFKNVLYRDTFQWIYKKVKK